MDYYVNKESAERLVKKSKSEISKCAKVSDMDNLVANTATKRELDARITALETLFPADVSRYLMGLGGSIMYNYGVPEKIEEGDDG